MGGAPWAVYDEGQSQKSIQREPSDSTLRHQPGSSTSTTSLPLNSAIFSFRVSEAAESMTQRSSRGVTVGFVHPCAWRLRQVKEPMGSYERQAGERLACQISATEHGNQWQAGEQRPGEGHTREGHVR